MITSISFLDYPEKKKNSREENNRDCSWRRGRTKKIQNKERLSEHNETSIKFLKEAIRCIPLANEDGADFENTAFLFNPPAGHFIVIYIYFFFFFLTFFLFSLKAQILE